MIVEIDISLGITENNLYGLSTVYELIIDKKSIEKQIEGQEKDKESNDGETNNWKKILKIENLIKNVLGKEIEQDNQVSDSYVQ